jgi:hypothetical protein
MAKTDDWVTNRFVKVELQVTAAMVTALASLTTAEWIDISSIFAGPLDQPQEITKDVEETPVSGDATPITSLGTASARRFAFTVLYTEGEVLGTDNLDPYQDILKPVVEYGSAALSMPMRWSPAGGNSGDNLYTTSATESWVTSLSDPVGGVTSEKIMISFELSTPDLTTSTV